MPLVSRRKLLGALVGGVAALGLDLSDAWAKTARKSPARKAPNKGKSPSRKAPPRAAPPPAAKLIMIDPGHGGRDPGALGVGGTQEKTVVLAVARELQRELLAGNRYRVLLTRGTDSYLGLRERVARAEAARADLFLSLHADSHPDPDVRGASIYTLSEDATDREAAALAARENRSDLALRLDGPSGAVARALVAMSQRGTVNSSRRLADTIVETFGRNGVRLLPRTHRQAGFAVLTSPDIPAALVEMGYLSNRQDEKLLTVRQHQQALARALRASIDAHFANAATRKA